MFELLLFLWRVRRYVKYVSQSTFAHVGAPDACAYIRKCGGGGASKIWAGGGIYVCECNFLCKKKKVTYVMFFR